MKKIFIILLLGSFFIQGRILKGDEQVNDEGTRFCAPYFDPSKMKEGEAPLLEGLGSLHYTVSTQSEKAQSYFNQGLTLLYAFNHGEAGRSFLSALRHDPKLAMAYWGLAMVLGPNYNAALNPTSLKEINSAIDSAVKLSTDVSPREKALILAVAKRFPRAEVKNMEPYYEDYAAAMKEASIQYPDDIEMATLYAEALMNIHPWNLWLKDGTAQPWTGEIVSYLESILTRAPDHPGAIHYYIHATEASKEAARALPFADKLAGIIPGAGHLVHMPAHTYIRTGDYHKGVLVTELANIADSSYIAQCKVQGVYPLLYYPHNIHFLAACAFFEGSSKKAIDAAWLIARKSDKSYLLENVTIQHYSIIPYYVLMHLGKWQEILELPKPSSLLKYPTAIWHYVRGIALAAKGNLKGAKEELKSLKKIAGDESLKSLLIWDMNSAFDLVTIGSLILEGELLAYNKQYAKANEFFQKAIDIEDRLAYTEPPDWFFSTRHTAGHWLVQAGSFIAAEKMYRDDLKIFPENGWALMGLYNSLVGQHKLIEANDVRSRFEKAWKHADFSIKSSRKF